MLAPTIWLKPLSKFVLEVSPLISAVLVGAYLAGSVNWKPTAAETLFALPGPDSAASSGEELTSLIKAAHAAVAEKPQASKTQALQPDEISEPSVAVAAIATPESRPRTTDSRAAKPTKAARPAKSATSAASVKKDAILPPPLSLASAPQPAIAAAEPTWLGRSWGTVAGWGEKAAKVTKLDYAVDVVADTPFAVVRVGKKTLDAVASVVVPESRR